MPPIMTMAAMTTPIWLPMPPSTTMERIVADSMKVKDSGEMKRFARGEERAGEAGEHRADGEGGELGVGGVDAERAAGDLVLAQRFPGAADRQPAQPDGDEAGEQGQRQDQIIEKDDAIERREFGRPNTAAKPSSSALNGMPKKVGRGMLMMPA